MARAQRLEQIEEGHTVVLGEVEKENPQHFQVLDQGLGLCSQLVPQRVQVVTDRLDGSKAKHSRKKMKIELTYRSSTRHCNSIFGCKCRRLLNIDTHSEKEIAQIIIRMTNVPAFCKDFASTKQSFEPVFSCFHYIRHSKKIFIIQDFF